MNAEKNVGHISNYATENTNKKLFLCFYFANKIETSVNNRLEISFPILKQRRV